MRFTYREKFSDNVVDMGLIDVRDDDDELEMIDDDVFVNSDDVDTSSVGSAASTTSTSSDEDDEWSPTIIHCGEGAELCTVRLGRLLGSGGFGCVYAGQMVVGGDRRRGRRVAVKVPRRRAGSGGGDTSTDSFLAESTLVHLRHPNLVSVLAAGWICGQLDGRGGSTEASCDDIAVDMTPAIVMEFAGRRNLQSVIDDSSQSLSLRRRLNYAYDMTSALAYIHRHRFVHLDVKPANIIVTDSDRCKLTDFGCSQRLASDDDDEAVRSATQRRPGSPTLNGTFAYRAPELLRGGAATPAADVYSLGVTLWQLRSRSSPYAGRDWHAVIFAVVAYHDRPDTSPALRRRRSAVGRPPPTAVSDVGRTPDRRYRSVFRSCWNANADARPTAAELVRLFQTWRTELDDVCSSSSFDADDTNDS